MKPPDIMMAPVYLPLLGAALAFCAKAFFRGKTGKTLEYTGIFLGLGLPWLALAWGLPLVLSGQTLQIVMGNWFGGVGILYRFDGLGWLVILLGYSVATAAYIYSLGAGPRGPEFSGIFLIQTAALAATAMTVDLFNLFVCLEVMGIASYVLVAKSEKPGAFLAAFSYLMVSATAMVFFLIGFFGLYRLTGALSYQGIAEGLRALPDNGGVLALVSLSLVVAAVAIRVAVMPLYGWLPDAHALAPHAISAVLSGVLIKTPLFALSRILMVLPAGPEAGRLLGYAGAVTALAGVTIALAQKDTKRLLAYHSISQIGYVVTAWGAALALGAGTPAGLTLMTAAFLHAFYHALFKGLLFLTIGTTTDLAGERDVYLLRGAAGMLRRAGETFPLTLLSFVMGALAITAIPPLNGFASKAALSYALKGTWQDGFLFLAGIGTTASFIKLSRIYWPVRRKAPVEAVQTGARIHPAIQISQGLLALLCLAGGLAGPAVSRFVMTLLGGGTAPKASLPPFLFSPQNLQKTAVIAAGGVILFLLASTAPGKSLMHIIRRRPRGFQGLFLSFALGLAGLSFWLIINK